MLRLLHNHKVYIWEVCLEYWPFLMLAIGRVAVTPGGRKGALPASLSVNLAEHDVEGADDGDNVGEHVVAADVVDEGKVEETRRLDLAPGHRSAMN